MALISCSECGKQVSDKAASCPNCGAPISAVSPVSLNPQSHTYVTRTGAKWEGIGFVLIVIGLVMAIASQSVFGGLLMLGGFMVFIVGRFK
jgi:uncharacterized membrane protein YvbJ